MLVQLVTHPFKKIFEIGIPFGIKRIPDSQNLNPFQKKTESQNHPDKWIKRIWPNLSGYSGLIQIFIRIYRKFLFEMVYINPIAIFHKLLSPLTPLCELVKVPLWGHGLYAILSYMFSVLQPLGVKLEHILVQTVYQGNKLYIDYCLLYNVTQLKQKR